MTAAAQHQQAERRSGYHPEKLIAAAGDGWLALAGATIALAISDCRAGDTDACCWLITGPGRRMLSLLVPTLADEDVVYERLRAYAPAAVQPRLFR